jgi:hypothetical protein
MFQADLKQFFRYFSQPSMEKFRKERQGDCESNGHRLSGLLYQPSIEHGNDLPSVAILMR